MSLDIDYNLINQLIEDNIQSIREYHKPKTLKTFFQDLEERDSNTILILDVITGVGKTEAFIQYVMSNYGKPNFKVVYASKTKLELCETILRCRRLLIEGGMRSDHANEFFKAKNRCDFHFGKHEQDAKQVIKTLKLSPNWSAYEIKFIESLITETNKYESKSHIIFSTHSSVALHAEHFEDYVVVLDEKPTFLFEEKYSTKRSGDLLAYHCLNYEFSGHGGIDEDYVSVRMAKGVTTVSQLDESHILNHLNPRTPFKACIIMTAYSDDYVMLMAKLGFDIEVYKTEESIAVVKDVEEGLIDFVVLDRDSISNKDVATVRAEAMERVTNPSKAYEVSTADCSHGAELRRICTNKTGSNSYSDLNECILISQLNFDKHKSSIYKKLFTPEEYYKFWLLNTGGKLLQSIFRGCIRNGKKQKVICGSREIYASIVTSLRMYLN